MYEANEAPFPFWGAKTSSKGGRDPLAVISNFNELLSQRTLIKNDFP